MTTNIKGKLVDGFGKPIANAQMKAVATQTSVPIAGATAYAKTDASGDYDFSLEIGSYSFSIWFGESGYQYVGNIEIIQGTPDASLDQILVIPPSAQPMELTKILQALVDAEAAAKSTAEEIRNTLTPLGLQYNTKAEADAAVANGTIKLNAYCYIRDSGNDVLANEWQNVNGSLVLTGKTMASQEYIEKVTEPAKMIEKSSDATFFQRWKDKIGTVIAGWQNTSDGSVLFKSLFLNLSPDEISGRRIKLSNDTISNDQITFKKGLDGVMRLIDKRGIVLGTVKNGQIEMSKLDISSLLGFSFKVGTNVVSIGKGKSVITARDKRGIVGFKVDEKGYIHGSFVNNNKQDYQLTESQIVQQMEVYAAAKGVNRYNKVMSASPKSRKKYKIILIYGQSFGAGAQSGSVLSLASRYNSVMLGQSPRGTYFSNPPAGSEVYGPVGGENKFYPLKEVCQDGSGNIVASAPSGYGETYCTTVADEFKRYHNESLGVDDDPNVVICVGSCAVSGRSIAQLQKDASPELYNRVRTFLSGVNEAVTAEGAEWEVVAIIYSQSENDNSQSYTYYQNQSITMRNNLVASCKEASGQKFDPVYLINQLGNNYVNGTGVPNAQISLPSVLDRTILVGSYQGLPNPGAHLCANSYRHMGALFARELWRYYDNNGDYPFKMVQAYHRGDTVWLSFSPHVTPMKFKSVYDKWTETLYDDKGISVIDSTSTLSGADLVPSIVSDRVIKIKASRALTGGVTVLLGDKAHNGIHNICDSSNEVAGLDWVYSGATVGQYTQENIPALVNKPYALTNFAAIQQISSEGI